jgi:hypothetical protein
MLAQPRPLREMCFDLSIIELVKSGLRDWEGDGLGLVKILTPAERGIRARGLPSRAMVDVFARMRSDCGGLRSGTLRIGHPFPDHVWVDETSAAYRPGTLWHFTCQGCRADCRKQLWVPGGKQWRCRRCVRPRYPYAARVNTLLPRPDAEDVLDFLERDLKRLRLLRKTPRRYDTVKRAPEWIVTL